MHELPSAFCWTRCGTEAGEPLARILSRKEDERRRNGGIFLWGIGNSIAPSLRALLQRNPEPSVIFSPMRTLAAPRDVSPQAVARWLAGVGLDGADSPLPSQSLVTSRYFAGKRHHFALVCYKASPLDSAGSDAVLSASGLRNFARGTSVGASQVTAVVERYRQHDAESGARYAVALTTKLAPPYLLKLSRPVVCVP